MVKLGQIVIQLGQLLSRSMQRPGREMSGDDFALMPRFNREGLPAMEGGH